MAQRRMFSQRIISSGKFLKMPQTSQALYFHLAINADDDGVVEAYKIIKMCGFGEDDLKVLASKTFVKVLNEDLVSYIMDWREHNLIRSDRKIDSIYKNLLLQIVPEAELVNPKPRIDVKDNSRRVKINQKEIPSESTISFNVSNLDTKCIQEEDRGQSTVGIGKDRLGKVSKDNTGFSEKPTRKIKTFKKEEYDLIIDAYQELKGLELKGNEFSPVQQSIKTMFLSGRTSKDIIDCMRWFSESEDEWVQSWTINTIKIKLPEFLAGKLKSKGKGMSLSEIKVPDYARDWQKDYA